MERTASESGYARSAVSASMMGYMLDGLDTMVLSLTLSAIGLTFALTSGQEGLIGLVLDLGMVVGGYAFGILSDYFGRVRTFTYSILIYSIFTAMTAVSVNYSMVLVTRFLSGVGTGAEYGIGMTLMAESFRNKWRGIGSAVVSLSWTGGVILATLASFFLIPLFGWRSLYVIGILPALLAVFVRFKLPESPMWKRQNELKKSARQKLAKGEELTNDERAIIEKSKGFSLTSLFNRRVLKITIVLLAISCIAEIGYWGAMTWLPSALMTEYHISFTKTIYILLATDFSTIGGIILFGFIGDYIGRRVAVSLGFVGVTIAAILFATARTIPAIIAGTMLLGFFIDSFFGLFGALFSEHYFTQQRSTAVNFLMNTGRGVGGLGPLGIGLLAPVFKISGVIGMFAILFIIGAGIIWIIPETRAKIIQ